MDTMTHPVPTSELPDATATGSVPADLTARLRALRDGLLTGLVERDVAVRLALLAALAGEHLLLIGPPGTAKSLIARRLHMAFDQATYFERLLTRFTVPEELFGPLSIKGLEEDRYERLTQSYLPTASIAFLDEIFKANSAILNALLTLLNEREFDNGVRREKTPLIAVIGASNELPEGEELHALFDRFLLRLQVGPVSKEAFPTLLGLRGEPTLDGLKAHRLTANDLVCVQRAAQSVAVPDDVLALLCDLREWCIAEGIEVSDRRWRKVVKLLQVSALTHGRDSVSIWDAWLLQHCLWSRPETREKLYDWYAARVGASKAMDPSRLTRIVVSWEGKLRRDQESRSQARDKHGRLLYRGADGKATTNPKELVPATRNGEPLFLAPVGARHLHTGIAITDRTNAGNGYTVAELDNHIEVYEYGWRPFKHWSGRNAYLADPANRLFRQTDPWMEPTRHKDVYIRACLAELERLRADVVSYRKKLLAHMESLEQEIHAHLWVPSNFARTASQSLDGTRREVDTLLARIDKLRQGFEMLPRELDVTPMEGEEEAKVETAPQRGEGQIW
jgi:MoxR-like ATPase